MTAGARGVEGGEEHGQRVNPTGLASPMAFIPVVTRVALGSWGFLVILAEGLPVVAAS